LKNINGFLPVSKEDLKLIGIDILDFILITGDSYVDHPSFGVAIIARYLEYLGFTVGIIAQPQNDEDYKKLGTPRLAFMVSGGNIDSMVAHYTVAKKKRSTDAYTAGGIMGKRPDRAVIVYSNAIKRIFPQIPLIIGGLEASLRRFAHYDYWSDSVMKSILIDSKADMISYGMGENQTREIAQRLNNNEKISQMTDIRGTCVLVKKEELPQNTVFLPSFNEVKNDKRKYAISCKIQYENQDHINGKPLAENYAVKYLLQNPPALPITQELFDLVYSLPYTRTYHPMYEALGGVDSIKEVRFSIIQNRGCFGGCNFCSLAFHQGRYVVSRSKKSIIDEAKLLTSFPDFAGYIHDVGGPTANFRHPSCKKQEQYGLCKNKSCLAPNPCPNLEVNHDEFLDILNEIRHLDKVKKVFIRSGIRYDYLMLDKDKSFFKALVKNHISGQLKVAPEHCSDDVLVNMGKPIFKYYKEFYDTYFKINKELNKKQYLVPYFMSSHPGCTLKDAVKLAKYLKSINHIPEQVQDFYPTPGTVSTCMYYTELNPKTLKPVYIAKTSEEKAIQRALLQYNKPQNRQLVLKALKMANCTDLIGNRPECLIKPEHQIKTIEYRLNKKIKRVKKK